MRSISRVCDVSINTVSKLLEDAGKVCMAFHDEKVRHVQSKRVQMDEIWSFTAAKISLYFVFYNFCRIHKTLKVTPAMAAGLTDKLMSFEDILALVDAAAPPVGRPKTYKKRATTEGESI